MELRTADLMDEPEGRESCDVQLRDYGGVVRFSGRIRTVECRDDNVLVREALSSPGHGNVLVVDGAGSLHSALVGDMIASLAVENGWHGLVIHGAVRDVASLRTLPIGIRALGSNPRRSGKAGRGAVDVRVTFGGATFRPGAMLRADEDGIVVENQGPGS